MQRRGLWIRLQFGMRLLGDNTIYAKESIRRFFSDFVSIFYCVPLGGRFPDFYDREGRGKKEKAGK